MVKVNRNKSFEEGLKDYLKTCNKDTVEANSIKFQGFFILYWRGK